MHTPHGKDEVTGTVYSMYLGYEEDEEAGHGGQYDHQHGQGVGGVDKQVLREDQTQRGSNPHHNDHDVDRDAGEPRVVDVVVLDVAALVGQEQPKHHQETLVDVESSDEVVEVVADTLFKHLQCVLCIVLSGHTNKHKSRHFVLLDSFFTFFT